MMKRNVIVKKDHKKGSLRSFRFYNEEREISLIDAFSLLRPS